MISDIWNILKDFKSFFSGMFKKNNGVFFGWMIPFGNISFDDAARFICHKNPLNLKSREGEAPLEHYKHVMIQKNLELFGKKPPSKWPIKIQDSKKLHPSKENQKLNCLVDIHENVCYEDIYVKRNELRSFISTLSKKGYE